MSNFIQCLVDLNIFILFNLQNIALTQIQLDDVIVAVGDHQFKAGVRKGLANRIILNKFSSTESDHVMLTLK